MRSVSPLSNLDTLTISSEDSTQEPLNKSLIISLNQSALFTSQIGQKEINNRVFGLAKDLQQILSPTIGNITSIFKVDNIPRLRLIFQRWQKQYQKYQSIKYQIRPIFDLWRELSFDRQVNKIQEVLNIKLVFRSFIAIKYLYKQSKQLEQYNKKRQYMITNYFFQHIINRYNRFQIIEYNGQIKQLSKYFTTLKQFFIKQANMLQHIKHHEISHYFVNWRNHIKGINYYNKSLLMFGLQKLIQLCVIRLVTYDQNYDRIVLSKKFIEISKNIHQNKKIQCDVSNQMQDYVIQTDIDKDLGMYKKFVQKIEFQDENKQDIKRLIYKAKNEQQLGNHTTDSFKSQLNGNSVEQSDSQIQLTVQSPYNNPNNIDISQSLNENTGENVHNNLENLQHTENINQLEEFLNQVETYQNDCHKLTNTTEESRLIDQLNLYKTKLKNLDQKDLLTQDLINRTTKIDDGSSIYEDKDKLNNFIKNQQYPQSTSYQINDLYDQLKKYSYKSEFPDNLLFKRKQQAKCSVPEQEPSDKKFISTLTRQQCIVKSLLFIINRNLKLKILTSWRIIMLKKQSYNIKNDLALRFFKFKIQDKFFQIVKKQYFYLKNKEYVLQRARQAVQFIQKQFCIRILHINAVTSKLLNIKYLYISHMNLKKLKIKSFTEIYSKYKRLTNATFRLKLIQKHMKKLTLLSIFQQLISVYDQIQNLYLKADNFIFQSNNFIAILSFNVWRQKLSSQQSANFAFQDIYNQFVTKYIPYSQDLQNQFCNQKAIQYDIIEPIEVHILTPGNWLHNYQKIFKNWHKYSIFTQLEQKIIVSRQLSVKQQTFVKFLLLIKCQNLVKTTEFYRKKLIFNYLNRSFSTTIKTLDFIENRLLKIKCTTFDLWFQLTEKVNFLSKNEVEIDINLKFNLKKRFFKKMINFYRKNLELETLKQQILTRKIFFTKYKFMFILGSFSKRKSLTGEAKNQFQCLFSPIYIFSKLCVFKKIQIEYHFPLLFFDFKISYLCAKAKVSSVFSPQIERLKSQLHAKILTGQLAQNYPTAIPDTLSLSTLDLKMDAIQQRLENLK